MGEFRPATTDQAELLSELLAAGVLIDTGVPGVYGRSATFEDVRGRFEELIVRHALPDGAESLRFPPLMPRHQLEATGYLKSFPHLAGSIFSFEGTEAEAHEMQLLAARHEDWSSYQTMTDLMLLPAACYPVYPALGARGPLPTGGATIDLGGTYCFRHEPSGDPARLQMFHQQELVRVGEVEAVQEWRELWRDRAIAILRGLGLDANYDVASDPFFGRQGRMLAANQRAQALKFEVVVQIAGPEPTAVASFNYHQDHFGSIFGIELSDGGVAHSACLGFGHERVVLALLHTHGLDPAQWPEPVRRELWGR